MGGEGELEAVVVASGLVAGVGRGWLGRPTGFQSPLEGVAA
ncbi:hypothetical protein [Candidatus Amarobacter glycogenicus]